MKAIRRGIFETNSSSTHSITILEGELIELFNQDELYLCMYGDPKTKEQLLEEYETIDDAIDDGYFIEHSSLETDVTSHTTKNGEEILIICHYGNDN